jgi:hypothetical protein
VRLWEQVQLAPRCSPYSLAPPPAWSAFITMPCQWRHHRGHFHSAFHFTHFSTNQAQIPHVVHSKLLKCYICRPVEPMLSLSCLLSMFQSRKIPWLNSSRHMTLRSTKLLLLRRGHSSCGTAGRRSWERQLADVASGHGGQKCGLAAGFAQGRAGLSSSCESDA